MKKKVWNSLFVIAIFKLQFGFSFAQSIDELEAKLKTASAEEKPSILNQLSEAYLEANPSKSIDYAEQALKVARTTDDVDSETGALINLGNGYSQNNNLKKSVQYYKKAIKIFEQYNQPASAAYVWNKIALANLNAGKTDDAISANISALELFKKANDKEGMVTMNIEIGDIYFKQKKYENSLPYYKGALKLYEDTKDARGQVTILHRIGVTHNNWGNFDEGYIFLSRAYELAQKNNLNSIANKIAPDLEQAKKNQSEYAKSKTEFEKKKEQETMEQIETKEKQISSLVIQVEKSMEEIEKLNIEAQNRELKIKIQNDEIRKKQLEAENQARQKEILKKEKEIADAQLNRQKIIIWSGTGFSVLGILLTVSIFIAYRNKKKSNEILRQKNEIIYKQKQQIEQKNILITDSIDYAKNIQEAILPPHSDLKKYFPESFIFYKPKDIVSGDFYWLHEDKSSGCLYVAAADCTGHGVPGAFMSLLGFITLEEVTRNHHLSPAEILQEVNTELMEILRQSNQNATGKFGMDIALIRYNKLKKEIAYSGAHNPLIIMSKGQITEIKADKISIGTTVNSLFTNHTISVDMGDIVYLYSDGFQDQIGGEKRKKFLAFHFKELLQQIHTLAPDKQKEELEKKHMEWRGKAEQTDDILIIGLKI